MPPTGILICVLYVFMCEWHLRDCLLGSRWRQWYFATYAANARYNERFVMAAASSTSAIDENAGSATSSCTQHDSSGSAGHASKKWVFGEGKLEDLPTGRLKSQILPDLGCMRLCLLCVPTPAIQAQITRMKPKRHPPMQAHSNPPCPLAPPFTVQCTCTDMHVNKHGRSSCTQKHLRFPRPLIPIPPFACPMHPTLSPQPPNP